MATYTTRQGDMWDLISYRLYGTEMHADALFNANLQYSDIAVFGAGYVLNVPEVEDEIPVSIPPWLRRDSESNESVEDAPVFLFERNRDPSYRLLERYVKIMYPNAKLHF